MFKNKCYLGISVESLSETFTPQKTPKIPENAYFGVKRNTQKKQQCLTSQKSEQKKRIVKVLIVYMRHDLKEKQSFWHSFGGPY